MTTPALLLALATLVLPSSSGTVGAPRAQDQAKSFTQALASAERAIAAEDFDKAWRFIERALERDGKALAAWEMRVRWAEAKGDVDELAYALSRLVALSAAQGVEDLETLESRLVEVDPISKELVRMRETFIARLAPIAAAYEEDGRPHTAIRVHKAILGLDPENQASREAIERMASLPDPSLAEDATPKDLFADKTEEWIAEFDAEHGDWKERAKLKGENYTVHTDAGYEVLVRTSSAMEQLNAFYREFFDHGTEEGGGSVPRVHIHIFKNREEYLEKGIGPPVEWSGGHYTGTHVETYIGRNGFEGMVRVLFHEAAHQFVDIGTNAGGWLNEGLASFFEGTRILPNGTVQMNLPANHRLFSLVSRMKKGWMAEYDEGLEDDPNAVPAKAPTFRHVMENRYTWGPPWYAPTWGVVYFLYNYQDPVDGRYVYRAAFQDFINRSGGRVGKGAVKNFEEVVLASPAPAYKGVKRGKDAPEVELPQTIDELTELWKSWCLQLADEQVARIEVRRPYKQWGRYAVENEDFVVALEHYEKGLVEYPDDPEMRTEFADLLADHFGAPDRAVKLLTEALEIYRGADEVDAKAVSRIEKKLGKLDESFDSLAEVEEELAAAARGVVQRYQAAEMPMMVMDTSRRLGTELGITDLFQTYGEAFREVGRPLAIGKLAYNEFDMEGWNVAGVDDVFSSDGVTLKAEFGSYNSRDFDYRVMTLDEVTSGDYTFEAEFQARSGGSNFCGFAFGRKSPANFHGALYFPPKKKAVEGTANSGFLDLTTFYGDLDFNTWRHVPIPAPEQTGSSSDRWSRMRIDVTGRFVDLWFDGELVATHAFPSTDVLRGSFGLITGNGLARFRNVRFLARNAGDPLTMVEREVALESLESAGDEGASGSGSFLGKVPPFPLVEEWVRGERSGWDDRGSVPQLFVMWSIAQNDIVPIDRWLAHLASDQEKIGLEIVCLASPNDLDQLEGYLQSHPFPGVVGVDQRLDEGIGDTFEMYDLGRYNLPRLILLDTDQRVVWEGDPGFKGGRPSGPPFETFLDDPLAELTESRNLIEMTTWRNEWVGVARPALAAGDLASAAPSLIRSEELDRRASRDVAYAQNQLRALQAQFAALASTAESFVGERTEPAAEVLLEWAEVLEHDISRKERKLMSPALSSDHTDDWEAALKELKKYKKDDAGKAAKLLEKLGGLAGRFVEELRTDLTTALEAREFERFMELCKDAPERPRRWLAAEFFGWGA